MKQVRVASRRADDCSGLPQRTTGGDNRYVWVTEDVLPCSQFQARDLETVVLKRNNILLVKAIETNVVIEQETRVISEDFLKSTGLKLNGFRRVVIDPGLADKKWMARGCLAEVLIHGQRIVDWTGRQLPVKAHL